MEHSVIERRVRAFVLLFFIVMFLLTLCGSLQACLENDPWRVGDWLINYQGGFVRRGLCGELFLRLWVRTGISPVASVCIVHTSCYGCFFLFSYLLIAKQPSVLRYLLLIVSPFVFTFQVWDIQGGYRKEILYLAVLAFTAWAARALRKKSFHRVSRLVLLTYPLAILSHEMLAIFLPYLLAIVFLRKDMTAQYRRGLIGLSGMSVCSFIATLLHSGTKAQVAAIGASLGRHAPLCRGAIDRLHSTATHEAATGAGHIGHDLFVPAYATTLLLSAIAFIPLHRTIRHIAHTRCCVVLISLSAIGTLPLCLVAADWGRFAYIHLVSLGVLCLAQDPGRHAAPCRDPRIVSGRIGIMRLVLCSLLLLCYASGWYLPHSAGDTQFVQGSCWYTLYKKYAPG